MFTTALFSTAVACGLLASSVNAHMIITQPVPYGEATLNNSPLENDGSDFPCKQRAGVYDIGTMNQMPVGVPQTLAFEGGATHGGGSCQVSVTLDKEPTKESQWKVIHSIIGGCPNPESGNAGGSADYNQNPTFQFSMPKGMPNGQYTLAWTWFNKLGNREIYMNCAPITVTGGADNNEVYNSLPDMFVINLPREECETTESEDFVFPNPGLYVETFRSTALGTKTSGSGCARVTALGAGAGNAGSPAPTPTADSQGSAPSRSPNGEASPPAYSAPYSIQTQAPSGPSLFAQLPAPPGTGMASVTDVVAITSMLTVTATAPASEQTQVDRSRPLPSGLDSGSYANIGPDPNGTTSSDSCPGGGVSCATDGDIVCIGSDQWGLCNIGCAFPMALAAGTSCSGGVIGKRHDAHLRKHLHRRHSF